MSYPIIKGNGEGYYIHTRIRMTKCFQCGKDNYKMAIPHGRCVWCKFDPNVSEQPKGKKQ